MVSRRLLTDGIALTAAVLLIVICPRSVLADGDPGGGSGNYGGQQGTSGVDVNGTDVTVNAGLTQGTGSSSQGSSATVTTSSGGTCSSRAIDPVSAANLINQNPNTSTTMTGDPGAGTWYVITCPGTTPSLLFVGAPIGQQAPPPPLAQPQALAQEALATLHLPGPAFRMSPASTAQIVNFQDWLWVDPSIWHPISATATAGRVSATATATPDRVVYVMGDGGQVVCNGPGTPYDTNVPPDQQSTNCSYMYRSSSAGQPGNRYTATATIYWTVRWTAAGALGGGNLGQIPGETSSAPVEVDEIQAVNVAAR